MTSAVGARAGVLAAALVCAACSGKVPQTRYYQLVAAPHTQAAGGTRVLVLETLSTDAAYDDERIVYRTTPFRLDYYQYQRWSSTPGIMVSNYLEQAFEASGKFRAVVREMIPEAPVVLSGRVIAIEEVDRSRTEWLGRIAIELVLSDARTSEAIWTEQLEETEPLHQQTPEGLAAALSVAMSRITTRTVPIVADLSERQARAHAELPSRYPIDIRTEPRARSADR